MLRGEESKSGQTQLMLALAPERRVFRVGELNAEVQNLFERQFGTLWVVGEISGCRASGNGHFYFVLKDRDAQLKCVLFKSTARYAKLRPQDGLEVIARGMLEVYAARGEYQLVVETLEPQGTGALQLAFDALKKKLAAEGLFESARKRRLPRFPQRIGLVTSPAGAVLRDMLHVWERRFPGLHIRLFAAQVQGEGAREQICAGLQYFSRGGWADVIVVARGGGSLEDLWAFNEEAVARAVAASKVPVISAVGHETDFTICDFAADYRAPTPSAAAEIAVPTRESVLEQLAERRSKMAQAMRFQVLAAHRRLDRDGTERSGRILLRGIGRNTQRWDEADGRLRRCLESQLSDVDRRLTALLNRLRQSDLRLRLARNVHRHQQLEARLREWRGQTRERREAVWRAESRLLVALQESCAQLRARYSNSAAHLVQLSPLAVLGRGYAIVESKTGQVIRSSRETVPGEPLRVRLAEGGLRVTVDSYTEE